MRSSLPPVRATPICAKARRNRDGFKPLVVLAAATWALLGCPANDSGAPPSDGPPSDGPPAPGATKTKPAWLRGDLDHKLGQIEKHLRGFDMAMVETGHRYVELFWAGRDENWGYARYQIDKIETAIANGLERRPKRAASAAMIEEPLRAVRAAVDRGDRAAFTSAFTALTQSCNACHQAEDVAFVTIAEPTERASAVRPGSPRDTERADGAGGGR